MNINEVIQELMRQNPGATEQQVRAQLQRWMMQKAMRSEREYDPQFRSVLADPAKASPAAGRVPGEAKLRTVCHCGQLRFESTVRGSGGEAPEQVRCYCRRCRRFHSSAFSAFTPVEGPKDWTCGGKAFLQRDFCAALGEVDRVVCKKCFSKVATLPLSEERRPALLALGCVEDASVPEALARHWQVAFTEWEVADGSGWWSAAVSAREGQPRRTTEVRGGCACGSCAFTCAIFPGEAQHCYCKLCRQLAGSAAMTWIPCANEDFSWTKTEGLQLVRTTRHGQRHICTKCGGVMTIVYDAQPDCTWPVAGALDDDTLPRDWDGMWYRVIHICCSMMQPWYRLPDDCLPRLKYAG